MNKISDTVKNYILFLLDTGNSSHSYANQAISAIKFLFQNVIEKQITEFLPRPKREIKLPNVLSQEEVFKILQALDNKKHKTLLFLIYSSGLRVGEVTRLKIEDIDSTRMLLHVKQGKGKKDRYTLLSEIALSQLRRYYMLYKPEIWLFPGGKEGDHITERTVQRVFEDACVKAKILKKATVHTLRHYVESQVMVSE